MASELASDAVDVEKATAQSTAIPDTTRHMVGGTWAAGSVAGLDL